MTSLAEHAMCHNCEIGHQLSVRHKEHQKDAENVASKFTRANRKEYTMYTTSGYDKSAIKSARSQNNVFNWEGANYLDKDFNPVTRKIRETIQIRKRGGGAALNCDDGAFHLDHVHC